MNIHMEAGGKTPLHQAAIVGSVEEVKKLISCGARPDIQTRRGRTALHYAAENGHREIVGILLGLGAQVDLPNKWGRTALHYAASKHRLDCIQALIDNGADPNKQDVDKQTPLYHAVAASAKWMNDEVGVCDTVLRDSDVCYTGMRDYAGHSIHGSDTRVLATEMLDTVVRYTILILISAGADADIPDKSGVTPLHLAAELGNSQICIHLLEEGRAQVNACDQYGATPLQYAAYQGHKNIAKILFSHGGFSGDCVAKQNRMSFVKHDIASSERELQPLAHVHRDISGITSSNGEHFDSEKEEFAKLEHLENVEPAESEGSKELLLSEEASLSLMLLQLNGTEGVGCVKRIAEVERIEQDIGRYIEVALQGMIQAEPRFSYSLLKSGSTSENTKVGEPDEIDYMCCLTELSKVCYPHQTSCDPHGYLRIKVQSQGLNQWNDCVDRDGFLIAEKVHQHFHSMFDLHSENSDLTAMSNCLHKMRDYRERPELGVTVDMSKTKPGSKLYFLWRGCQFKRLIVEVDLIPAVEILGWPQTAIVSPQEGCSLYHVIPKVSPSLQNNPSAGLYWRISTSLAEKSLFKTMSAPALACYTICKLLMHSSNPVQLFSHSMDFARQDLHLLLVILHRLKSYDALINSYLLKMIFFREKANLRQGSDWEWSTVGIRVLGLLNKLLVELKQGYVPSYFLQDYDVLTKDDPSDIKQ